MKKSTFRVYMLSIVSILCVSISLTTVVANPHSTQIALPEGAKARLGKGGINAIAYSPDSTRLAVSSDLGIWMYDTDSGEELGLFVARHPHLDAHAAPVSIGDIAFSPDGNMIATAGYDDVIRLWDALTGEQKAILTGHESSVSCIAFSPDGRTLASTSYDSTVLLWEAAPTVETVQLAPRMETPTGKPTALLPNYPNPFNPETWIPYQLADAADVTVRIYAVNGILIRTLALGHQLTGSYHNRQRAAYWDGKNEIGEPVASGLYFYTLSAGRFTATRKMLIRK